MSEMAVRVARIALGAVLVGAGGGLLGVCLWFLFTTQDVMTAIAACVFGAVGSQILSLGAFCLSPQYADRIGWRDVRHLRR